MEIDSFPAGEEPAVGGDGQHDAMYQQISANEPLNAAMLAQGEGCDDDAPPPDLPSRFPRAVELQPLENAAAAPHLYWDRSHYESPEAQVRALQQSSTVYVGNLSFSTRSAHVVSMFTSIGRVKAVHMGLDRLKKTPCGFCFVEFWNRDDALASVQYCSGSKLDGSVIRVELDAGFQPGRQYGRGRKGGQTRDDRRDAPSGGRHQGWTNSNNKRTAEDASVSNRASRAGDEGAGPSAEGYQEDDDEERAAKRQRI
jgi:nuclear cap-binding protein subunit 2